MGNVDLRSAIGRNLEALEYAPRIKKLLFCVVRQTWPTDGLMLESLGLETLLDELQERYSTLAEVETELSAVVSTLNKPAEYTLIANLVLSQIQPLYHHGETGFRETRPLPPEEAYEAIAQQIDQSTYRDRFKKLLLCATTNRWESDSTLLAALHLPTLLRTLRRLATRLSDLNAILTSIVATLNKPEEYAIIATVLVDYLKPLYPEPATAVAASPALETQAAEHTLDLTADGPPPVPLAPPALKRSAAAETLAAEHTLDLTADCPAPAPADPAISETTAELAIDDPSLPGIALSAIAPCAPTPIPPKAPTAPPLEYNLFDVKQDVMQYTNALQAKLLLTALLQGRAIAADAENFHTLRQMLLDQLLEQMLTRFSTFSALEERLRAIAPTLPPALEGPQTANALLQAVRRIYPSGDRPSIQLDPEQFSVLAAQPATPDDVTHLRSGAIAASDNDDEATCQFFPHA